MSNPQSPKEIDTALAKLYYESMNLRRRLEGLEFEAKSEAGANFYYRGRQRVTDMTIEQAEEILAADIAQHEDDQYGYTQVRKGYNIGQIRSTVRKLGEVRTNLTSTYQESHKLEALYTGWSRFFLVTSSQGHIHSSMHCGQCRPTTTYAWLPELSGKSEAEAVEAHGPALCSYCYPTAPVEWTQEKLSKRDAEKIRDRKPTWAEEHEEEVTFLTANHDRHEFLGSLFSQFSDRGSLTDNQLAALRKWVEKAKVQDADRHQGAVTRVDEEPTEKQYDYIVTLAAELDITAPNPTTRIEASDLINRLKAQVLERRKAEEQEPTATSKQMSYINKLMDERKIPVADRRKARQMLDAGLTLDQASRWIEKLLTLPTLEG